MSIPHDHHFIPAFYLKQWTGADNKLVEYTIKPRKLIAKYVGSRSTGYETDLYAFPELPANIAQHLESAYFTYADQTASRALDNHLGIASEPWTAELVTAWSRFVLGIHLRHPDTMPELRAAAISIWDQSGVARQAEYEQLRKPEFPATFDEYLATADPLIRHKMQLNLVMTALDNQVVCQHINTMTYAVVDLSAARTTLLTSDRPVHLFEIKAPKGLISIPISPTKLFVAANSPETFDRLRRAKPLDIVRNVNIRLVSLARRFVWALDQSQTRFIQNRMSTQLEPTPFFSNLDRYDTTPTQLSTALAPPTPLPANGEGAS